MFSHDLPGAHTDVVNVGGVGDVDARGGAVAGLVLAAGAGVRMGRPKALLRDPATSTTWVDRAVRVVREGGCRPVLVTVGAAAEAVAPLVAPPAWVVPVPDWREGMGASLRAGLAAVAVTPADEVTAVLVTLVDLPGVTPGVVARLLTAAAAAGSEQVLVRAAYAGRPGHPVLIGRAHWPGVVAAAAGDAGARGYLAARAVRPVECGDVGHGGDVDTPADLATAGNLGWERDEPR